MIDYNHKAKVADHVNAVIDTALRQVAPAVDVEVRTHRYRNELTTLRGEITR